MNPLRYKDELVRHKVLDIIGDSSLAGNAWAYYRGEVKSCAQYGVGEKNSRFSRVRREGFYGVECN